MSEIKVDTLTGKTTANDITVTVGASATMSLEQGLAKAWVNFNGTGTVAIRDSFSISSISDTSTGNFASTYTNNMNNSDYSVCATVSDNSGVNAQWTYTSVSTSGFTYLTADDAGSGYTWTDYASNSATINGDLA
jgi:hypothetical protein